MEINWIAINFGIALLVTLKAVIVGSDFSFHDWIKYEKIYINWYFNRQTFKQFLEKNNE